MSRITDEQLADELEETMRLDYWRQFSVSELAKWVGRTRERVRRVLRTDSRFREYAPTPKHLRSPYARDERPYTTYCLWK